MGFDSQDKDKVAKGVVMTLLGRLAGLISGFFLFVVPLLMGDRAYGAYVIVYFSMELLGKVLVAGFSDAVTYFGARRAAARDEVRLYDALAHCVTWPLLASLVLVGAVWLGAPLAFTQFWSKEWDSDLIGLLRFGSLVFPLMVLVKLPVEAAKVHLDMKWSVLVIETALPLSNFAFVLLAWQLDSGPIGLVGAYVGSYLVVLPLALYGYSTHFSIRRTVAGVRSGFISREISGFAWTQGFNMLLSFGLGKVDTLMLSYWFGPEVISVYSRLTELPRSIRTAKTSFVGVFAPLVAKYKELNNQRGIEESLHLISRWTSGLSFPLLIGLLAFFPQIIAMDPGAVWQHSNWTPWLLTAGPMFSCFFGLAGNLLLMTGYSRVLLLNATLSMTVNVVLNLLFIPLWGPVGAALATMITAITISLLQLYELAHFEEIRFAAASFVKPLAGGLPTALVIFLVNLPEVHAQIFSFGVALGVTLKVATVVACGLFYAGVIYFWPGENPERAWIDKKLKLR